MWKGMNFFLTKNYPLRYRNYLSLPNKTRGSVHKKIGASSHSMKFLSPEVVISIDLPYWLAWNAILMSGLVIYRYYLVHVHLNLKSDSTLSFSRDVHSSFSQVAWFFFPFTARLCTSLPGGCFYLTYVLYDCMSVVNRLFIFAVLPKQLS